MKKPSEARVAAAKEIVKLLGKGRDEVDRFMLTRDLASLARLPLCALESLRHAISLGGAARTETAPSAVGASKAYTPEEVRELFLAHVRGMVDEWECMTRRPTVREKLEGLAFSILVALDGEAASLPGFLVIPNTPLDSGFVEEGYPRLPDELPELCDIAGALHEHFYRR